MTTHTVDSETRETPLFATSTIPVTYLNELVVAANGDYVLRSKPMFVGVIDGVDRYQIYAVNITAELRSIIREELLHLVDSLRTLVQTKKPPDRDNREAK